MNQLRLFVNRPPDMNKLKLNSGVNKKRIYTEYRNFNILHNKFYVTINYTLSGKMISYKIRYNPSHYVNTAIEFEINRNKETIIVTNTNSHLSHDSKKDENYIYFVLDGKFKRNVYFLPDIISETSFNYIYTKLGDDKQ